MKKCKYCQSEIDDKAKICPNCGKKQSHNVRNIVLGAIVVLILIAAFNGNDDTIPTSSNNQTNKSKQQVESKKKVTIIDFSNMSYSDIESWCKNNSINVVKNTSYSDSIAKDAFVSQSIAANAAAYEGDKITITYSLGKEPTLSQKNALKKAQLYLSTMAFSYDGLVKQLEYEKFSHEDAEYGVDNCGANWDEQAVKKGKTYLDTMAFSRQGLIEQLEYEGFTAEQATYAVNQIGL